MPKTCIVCSNESKGQPCTRCGYFDLRDLENPLALNQVLLAKKVLHLERQKDGALPPTPPPDPRTNPVQLSLRKMDLNSVIQGFRSFISLPVQSDLRFLTEQMNAVPVLQMAAQKEQIRATTPWKPQGILKYAYLAEFFARQEQMLGELLAKEEARIREELNRENSKRK